MAWGRLAEICQEYLKKGSLAYFEGPIQTRQWEDKDGQKKYTTEIKALNMQMLDSRSDAMGGGGQGAPSKPNNSAASVEIDDSFDDMDDDLPF